MPAEVLARDLQVLEREPLSGPIGPIGSRPASLIVPWSKIGSLRISLMVSRDGSLAISLIVSVIACAPSH